MVYINDLRLDVIPENGKTLTAKLLDLLDFFVEQLYLRLVTVLDVQPRRNAVEESDLVFLTGINQFLDISTLIFSIGISPL